jgi:hypothetical protein
VSEKEDDSREIFDFVSRPLTSTNISEKLGLEKMVMNKDVPGNVWTDEAVDAFNESAARFNAMQVHERTEVMNRPNMAGFSPTTKEIYAWNCKMLEQGPDDFSVPAMLIPGMLGMAYNARDSQIDYVRDFLKKNGNQGVDWVFKKKSGLFSNYGSVPVIEFAIPGRVGEIIEFSRNAGNAAKFPFITPRFARVLLLRSTSKIGRELVNFYTTIHDELLNYLRGKQSTLAPVINAVAAAHQQANQVVVAQPQVETAFDLAAGVLKEPIGHWVSGKNKRMIVADKNAFANQRRKLELASDIVKKDTTEMTLRANSEQDMRDKAEAAAQRESDKAEAAAQREHELAMVKLANEEKMVTFQHEKEMTELHSQRGGQIMASQTKARRGANPASNFIAKRHPNFWTNGK